MSQSSRGRALLAPPPGQVRGGLGVSWLAWCTATSPCSLSGARTLFHRLGSKSSAPEDQVTLPVTFDSPDEPASPWSHRGLSLRPLKAKVPGEGGGKQGGPPKRCDPVINFFFHNSFGTTSITGQKISTWQQMGPPQKMCTCLFPPSSMWPLGKSHNLWEMPHPILASRTLSKGSGSQEIQKVFSNT